jgi:hypothetical protein
MMLKRVFAGVAVMLLVLSGPGWSQRQIGDEIVIKPLGRHLDDAGCSFVFREASPSTYPIFLSNPEGIWMHLNGRETKLANVSDPDELGVIQYVAGDMRIKINLGQAKQNEGGATYNQITMMVFRNGQKKVVRAKGSCGC